MIRDATPGDAAAIARIHNELIAGSTVTFRSGPTDPADRTAWLVERREADFPVLVAEIDGMFAGYASYGPFRPGDGYSLTVEHSIHLAQTARGRGIGRALMTELVSRARVAGLHAMVGAISAENEASRDFHHALGFLPGAPVPQVGHKFGRWLDVEFWVLLLDDRSGPGGW